MLLALVLKDQQYDIIAVKQYSKLTNNQKGDQICNTGTVVNWHLSQQCLTTGKTVYNTCTDYCLVHVLIIISCVMFDLHSVMKKLSMVRMTVCPLNM